MNGTFEDKLLGELKQVVAERAAPPEPRRRWKPRLVLASAVAATTAACVAGSVILADRASPAWAVTPQPDGWVSVTIYDHRDADGLERRLEELGIPAEVDYLPPGQTCKHPRYEDSVAERTGLLMSIRRPSVMPTDGTRIQVWPVALGPDDTLVIETAAGYDEDEDDNVPLSVIRDHIGIATGPVAPCELVPLGQIPR